MTQTIRTERLTLRPIQFHDADALHAHWTHPDVRRFLFDDVVVRWEDVERTIAASVAGFSASGQMLWTLATADEFVGVAGLRPLDDLGSEVYYSLAPPAWGYGYAVEAAQAIIDYAFDNLDQVAVFAEVDVANTASAAVISKLSMGLLGHVDGAMGAMARYVIRRLTVTV